MRLAGEFADLIDEFDVRGKFTVLPCPAGLGRLNDNVRGYTGEELKELIAIVRDRIAERFDITPEVLTHSMALDADSGALLPHAETAWLTHLCATGQTERLQKYLRTAWQILSDVGIEARGVTIGGMSDPSGIGEGKSLLKGDCRPELAEAALHIEKEFDPDVAVTFIYTGTLPVSEASRARGVPERVFASDGAGEVFELHSVFGDPLLGLYQGQGDAVAEADKFVSADLERGAFIECIEGGKLLSFTVHCQTLNSLNTGLGFRMLREMIRRLHDRYGKRLVWHTPLELIQQEAV